MRINIDKWLDKVEIKKSDIIRREEMEKLYRPFKRKIKAIEFIQRFFRKRRNRKKLKPIFNFNRDNNDKLKFVLQKKSLINQDFSLVKGTHHF